MLIPTVGEVIAAAPENTPDLLYSVNIQHERDTASGLLVRVDVSLFLTIMVCFTPLVVGGERFSCQLESNMADMLIARASGWSPLFSLQ